MSGGREFRGTFARTGFPRRRSRRRGALFVRSSGASVHAREVDETNTVVLAVFASFHLVRSARPWSGGPGGAGFEAFLGGPPGGGPCGGGGGREPGFRARPRGGAAAGRRCDSCPALLGIAHG